MKPRACVVVASDLTVRAFLGAQLRAMQDRYDLTVVVNTDNRELLRELGVAGTLRPVRIERRIAPLRDVGAFLLLLRLMRRERFDLVHSMTPKAGLLAMAAAWVTRVPVRIHTFTGQVWATRRGISRALFKLLDRVVARCTTFNLTDSASQREFLIEQGILSPAKISVLGKGSVSGVDTARFHPDPGARRRVRGRLGIQPHDVVLLFVGRLHRDKGVADLARAFDFLAEERPELRLLVVGPDEGHLRPVLEGICRRHLDRVHFVEFTSTPEAVMAASDVLCLPSYREGFGSVIIEAAAVGLPAVASRIYGIVDAVDEGVTGLLHAAGDIDGLVVQLRGLVQDPSLRGQLGAAARLRAERHFSQRTLTSAILDFYARTIVQRPDSGTARACNASGRFGRMCEMNTSRWYRNGGKRVLDVVVAGLGTLVLLPVAVIVAVLVRCFLGSPVLFRQRRPGRHGVPFMMVKFRSMTERFDKQGRLLADSDRLTALGRILRSTSLDELPELWNVLKGDMSLVGPRPLLMEYLPLYTPHQRRRHDVRPGITGLAQVSGRNGLDWPERFHLDVRYVENHSLRLDLAILARTAWEVIARRGISQPGCATVDHFQGNVRTNG